MYSTTISGDYQGKYRAFGYQLLPCQALVLLLPILPLFSCKWWCGKSARLMSFKFPLASIFYMVDAKANSFVCKLWWNKLVKLKCLVPHVSCQPRTSVFNNTGIRLNITCTTQIASKLCVVLLHHVKALNPIKTSVFMSLYILIIIYKPQNIPLKADLNHLSGKNSICSVF